MEKYRKKLISLSDGLDLKMDCNKDRCRQKKRLEKVNNLTKSLADGALSLVEFMP